MWLGFVEKFEAVSTVAGCDVRGWLVLLPADAVRHAEKPHAFDGGTRRLAAREDFAHVPNALNEPDALRAGVASRSGISTVVATKRVGQEMLRAVFELLPGKRNRALALLSLVVMKVGRPAAGVRAVPLGALDLNVRNETAFAGHPRGRL